MATDPPPDYVDNQKRFNEFHKDGRKVLYYEESKALASYYINIINSIDSPKDSFLDLGCRMGYCLPLFGDAFPQANVLGVDIVPEFVEEAQKEGNAQVGDAHNLPFPDDEFDYTFCAQTLEHCYDPQKAANEIMRVSRCGFLVGIPLEGSESYNANPSHYAYSDNAISWLRLFEKTDKFRLFHAVAGNSNTYMNFIFLRVLELGDE